MDADLSPSIPLPHDTEQRRRRRLVAVFALTQTLGYGSLFQAFTVLLIPISHELGVSRSAVTAAATISTLVGAVAALPVGALLDRYGGRALMTCGSALGVLGVFGWSQATDLTQLYLSFVLVGLALAMSTYEAAFAVLVVVADAQHRDRAIVVVSMVTGFATSLYYPLVGWLEGLFGWRTTLVGLAAALAVFVVPAHLLGVPGRTAHARRSAGRSGARVAGALRSLNFWLLLISFVAQAGATSAFLLLMVSYFRDIGFSLQLAAALPVGVGVFQLVSRLATVVFAGRYGMARVTAVAFGVQGLGLLGLPLAGRSLAPTLLCLAAFGLGYGISVVARPSITAELFGVTRFASIYGAMTVPVAVAKAGVPLLAASVADRRFLFLLGAAGLLAAAALIPVMWSRAPAASTQSNPAGSAGRQVADKARR